MRRKKFLPDQPVHTFIFSLATGRLVSILIYGNVAGRSGRCFMMDDFSHSRGTFVKCRFKDRDQMEKAVRWYIRRNQIPVKRLLREEHCIGFYIPYQKGFYRVITEFFSTEHKNQVRANSFVFGADDSLLPAGGGQISLNIKSHQEMMFYANSFWKSFHQKLYVN